MSMSLRTIILRVNTESKRGQQTVRGSLASQAPELFCRGLFMLCYWRLSRPPQESAPISMQLNGEYHTGYVSDFIVSATA
jgi:hypothetical protein